MTGKKRFANAILSVKVMNNKPRLMTIIEKRRNNQKVVTQLNRNNITNILTPITVEGDGIDYSNLGTNGTST